MTDNSQSLIEFLKTPFPYFFLIASLVVSIMLLSNPAFIKSIYNKDAETEELEDANVDIIYFPEGESKFTITCVNVGSSSFSELDMIKTLTKRFATLMSMPAIIATMLSVHALQIDYPNLDPETYELFAILGFVYFNMNFWILLSYLINKSHDTWLKEKPQSKSILSVISK